MGLWNPSSPVVIGGEWSPQSKTSVPLTSPQQAVAFRVAGTAITCGAFWVYLDSVAGNPGLCVEIVDTLVPALTNANPNSLTNVLLPTTDTNSVVTGWVDQGGAAANFGDVNKRNQSASYLKPSSTITAARPVSFQSSGPALSSKRIVGVYTGVAMQGVSGQSNSSSIPVSGDITISNTKYPSSGLPGGTPSYALASNNTLVDTQFLFPTNPAIQTNEDPAWTVTAVNVIINSTDRFGATFNPTATATGLRVMAVYCAPIYCTENRFGFYHAFQSAPRTGWNRVAVSFPPGVTGLLSAASFYWVIISCPKASPSVTASIPLVTAKTVLPSATVAGTGESRGTSLTGLVSLAVAPCGPVSAAITPSNLYMIPVLLESTTAFAAATHTNTTVDGFPASTLTQAHIGCAISGGTIPANTFITAVASATSCTISQAAGGTGAITATIGQIEPQSQPYAAVRKWTLSSSPHDDSGPTSASWLVLTTPGQQITVPTGGPYTIGGIQLAAYWETPGTAPNQPLKIQIRHGAGAITGGGTLDATATLPVVKSNQGNFFGVIPFDNAATFSAVSGTQYFVSVSSAASSGRGWVVYLGDTRTDLATSVFFATVQDTSATAAVENAGIGPTPTPTVGGQTDSAYNNGAAITRYDWPVAFVQAGSGAGYNSPGGLTATVRAGLQRPVGYPTAGDPWGVMSGCTVDDLPPRVILAWTATGAGVNFGGYNVYRRPTATPALPWRLLAAISIPPGYTAATVEAQHNGFVDYTAGWSVTGGRYQPGWDYAVTLFRSDTGVETVIGQSSVTKIQPAASPSSTAWVASNQAPWLSFPAFVFQGVSGDSGDAGVVSYDVAGRDGAVTRTRLGTPLRTLSIGFARAGQCVPSEIFDLARCAAVSGRQFQLLDPTGDTHAGSLAFPDMGRSAMHIDGTAAFAVTSPDPAPADFNRHTHLVGDGTTGYVTTPNAYSPQSTPWAMMMCAKFVDHANDVYMSDGSVVAGALGCFGFYRSAAGTFAAKIRGASATLTLTSADAAWFDGDDHVAFLVYNGTTYTLYRVDLSGTVGVMASSSTVVGQVTNSAALVAGADNAGASGWTATPIQAWGLWLNQTLTVDQVTTTGRYLLGMAGYRMTPGANVLYHAHDLRCWNGIATTMHDLAGIAVGTVTGTVNTRGIPGTLADLDRMF